MDSSHDEKPPSSRNITVLDVMSVLNGQKETGEKKWEILHDRLQLIDPNLLELFCAERVLISLSLLALLQSLIH